MKLMEFINKREGQTVSQAFLTFGKFYPDVKHRGLYVSICIPAWKKTITDFCSDADITGWYGCRVNLGYYVTTRGKISIYYRNYWDLIKKISSITRKEKIGKARYKIDYEEMDRQDKLYQRGRYR